MLQFQIIPVTHYQQNCTLLWCDETREAAVVDPGGDIARILAVVAEKGETLRQILLTHGHMDHIGGTAPNQVRAAVVRGKELLASR